MATLHRLAELRAGDVMIFLAVARCGTVNGAARELQMPGSQVSKAVARLEEQLGLNLLVRSTRGVALSDEGVRLLPQLSDVARRIETLDRRDDPTAAITIAAPAYLASTFIPRIAAAPGLSAVRVRAMEMAPALIRALASAGVFDVCITVGRERLPDSWSSVEVGAIGFGLFGPPALRARLGTPPYAADAIRAIPFVVPSHQVARENVPIADGCPLTVAERTPGHEAHSIHMALHLAAATAQLVYGPMLAAKGHLDSGALVELPVDGWERREPLFVVCNVDRVSSRQQREIGEVVESMLVRLAS